MFDLFEVFYNETWEMVATELFFSVFKRSGVHDGKFKKRSEKESAGVVTRNMLFDILLVLKNE